MNLLVTFFVVVGSNINKNLPARPCFVKMNRNYKNYSEELPMEFVHENNCLKTQILQRKPLFWIVKIKFKTKSSPSLQMNIITLFN